MDDDAAEPKLRVRLMPGSSEIAMAITERGEVVRSAAQLEDLIRRLIGLREMMSPPIPIAPPTEGVPVITAGRMRWHAKNNPNIAGAVSVMLLHPGLGWLGISIPQESAQELAATILRCALPAGSGRAN